MSFGVIGMHSVEFKPTVVKAVIKDSSACPSLNKEAHRVGRTHRRHPGQSLNLPQRNKNSEK